ncbi:Choline transporter-like [Dillenia turbinata]|uniref:Choline transporter-like n=1 Tax=Dillenia turbinata TaxID=194707 RepID=A0AAN8YYA5_9MAGN
MASTEESTKDPILLYDSSSSATQPLLSSKPYPELGQQTHEDSAESDQTQYIQISYNYNPRQFKDLPFLILFILFVLCTYGFGIFAVVNKNSDYSNVSSYVYDSNSSSCVEDTSSLSLSELGFSKNVFLNALLSSSSSFVRDLIWVLVITVILSVPICYSVLLLLKHYTKQIVYVSIPFLVLIPIFFNVYWFVACTVNSSCSDAFPLAYRILVLVFVFLVIGIIVWIIVANWHRIELTARVVGVASHALSQNLGLFGVLPGLTLGLVIYFAPIIVFLVFARFNGEIVVEESSGEYSCGWKQDSWVPAYFALAILTLLWSATVLIEIQVYVISGTVSQWYFSKDDSRPKKSIRSSLRQTLLDPNRLVTLVASASIVSLAQTGLGYLFEGAVMAKFQRMRKDQLIDHLRRQLDGLGEKSLGLGLRIVAHLLQCWHLMLETAVNDFFTSITDIFKGSCSSSSLPCSSFPFPAFVISGNYVMKLCAGLLMGKKGVSDFLLASLNARNFLKSWIGGLHIFENGDHDILFCKLCYRVSLPWEASFVMRWSSQRFLMKDGVLEVKGKALQMNFVPPKWWLSLAWEGGNLTRNYQMFSVPKGDEMVYHLLLRCSWTSVLSSVVPIMSQANVASVDSLFRNAFGPSSGTVCLSGLLICAVRLVRAAVDSARQEEASGIVNLILRCCVNAFLAAIDFLNKFTINFAAITGEAYCTSARMTFELLKRNLLSAVMVETVTSRLLAGIVFVLSAIYATAVWGILKGIDDLGVYSYYVALLAWALLIVVLGFFVHVLDNVIDTVYVCYAIDRDRGEVCKQDVHEVYVHLPISRNNRFLPARNSHVV